MGNLLAERLRQTKVASEISSYEKSGREKEPQEDPAKRAFNAALAEAYKDPEFVKMARRKSSQRVSLFDDGLKEHGDATAGDGIYSGFLSGTQIPGSYALKLIVQASSLCGRVTRTESTATLVEVATIDPRQSIITAMPVANGRYAILVAPADRFGNLIGPGNPGSIEIFTKGAKSSSQIRDLLDGSYEQVIEVDPRTNPKVTLLVNGKLLANVPLEELLPKRGRF